MFKAKFKGYNINVKISGTAVTFLCRVLNNLLDKDLNIIFSPKISK